MKHADARRSIVIEEHRLRALLASVAEGRTEIDAALGELRHLPYEDIGYAKVDHHRALRDWMPEVVLGEGKTAEQIVGISRALLEQRLQTACMNTFWESTTETLWQVISNSNALHSIGIG